MIQEIGLPFSLPLSVALPHPILVASTQLSSYVQNGFANSYWNYLRNGTIQKHFIILVFFLTSKWICSILTYMFFSCNQSAFRYAIMKIFRVACPCNFILGVFKRKCFLSVRFWWCFQMSVVLTISHNSVCRDSIAVTVASETAK